MSEVTVGMAVLSLRPGAEWTMSDNDVENITWHTEGVQPLTQAEVTAEVARLEQAAIDKQAAKETAVKSGRAKLLALGLTNEASLTVKDPVGALPVTAPQEEPPPLLGSG